jgi:hypothetical protein
MFEYFKYVDLPKIPSDLLETINIIESKENYFKNKSYRYYKQYKINLELNDFLKSIMPLPFRASYQIIRSGIDIHKDIGRLECFNYLLDNGGDDSKLTIYDENKTTILHQEHIEPFRWHWICVNKFHGVSNLIRPRIAITVSIDEKYSFSNFKIV